MCTAVRNGRLQRTERVCFKRRFQECQRHRVLVSLRRAPAENWLIKRISSYRGITRYRSVPLESFWSFLLPPAERRRQLMTNERQ